jgi:hypothetical protein
MKLDPSIIALKDFRIIKVFRLKLARYSTANKALSINASGQKYPVRSQHGTQLLVLSFVHNMTPNVLDKIGFVHNIYTSMKHSLLLITFKVLMLHSLDTLSDIRIKVFTLLF